MEDDPDDTVLFIEALNEIKTATLFDVAGNGVAALEKLQNAEQLPDMIFMAIHLPMMNGIDCLKEIVNNTQFKNIPVVILSSDKTQVNVIRNLGASAFLAKPASFKVLKEKVEEIVNLDFDTDKHIAAQTFLD